MASPTLAEYNSFQLHKDNLKMKAALQEALDIRLAKEGEVSILRQSMHKVCAVIFH
jgi:hypothetical protein